MFKNHDEYVSQRNALIAEAEQLVGQQEAYDAKIAEINALDAAYEQYAQQQTNLEALKGAVKAPLSASGVSNVVSSILSQDAELEYRKQFMSFVMNGTPIKMSNNDAYTTTSDVGAVIPTTILDKIVEKLDNDGGIYAKMTKTFFKGGVTVPTSSAKPVATWTTERGGSDKQKKALGSVTFTYHKLRCVVALSLATANVTLDVFEKTIAANIADAMIKAIESAAFTGTGSNEPLGILKETAPAGQVIETTEGVDPTYDDFLACEGALPSEYDNAEWYMRKSTFYAKFLGMKDTAGQPIARVSEGVDGKPKATILGRPANFTDNVPAFAATVSEDTPYAVIFDFADYVLNTNLAITVKEYEDHDTDDQIKKAVMLADGKAIDLNSLVILQVKN